MMQYCDLIKKGNLIDLGIGEVRNVFPFAFLRFNDISEGKSPSSTSYALPISMERSW
jgi:hypothetical protein